MALYFVLPLILAGVLITLFHWEAHVTGPMQVLGGIAYLVWSVAGLVSFLRYMSPDARELITDTVKLYFGKK
jgi:hypothetical protein